MRTSHAAVSRTGPIVDPYENSSVAASVGQALRIVRAHLDMDVAFISEFVGDTRIFRHVDRRADIPAIGVGQHLLVAEGYCKRVVDGTLPQIILDTATVPETRMIAATHDIPIGSHLSVPLRRGDGQLYGALCCFSFKPKVDLCERDLAIVTAFAELVGRQIEAEMSGLREHADVLHRIKMVLTSDQPSMVYQPSYGLSDLSLLGAEALSRFAAKPPRTPNIWFAEADRVDLKTELELKAIRNALDGFAPVWRNGPYYLAVNSSPKTILDVRLGDMLYGSPANRIMLEITEHDHVENYDHLMRALVPLRERGVRIAVDDAGSGYASMRHILNIRPDVIKLDVSLTNGIESDRARLALAKALCEFGRQTDCSLIAEGIETAVQLDTLRGIGVHAGQGYYLGRPMPFGDFSRLIPAPAVS